MLVKALVLATLCLGLVSHVNAITCTGSQSIATALVSGADSCFTVQTPTVDISTGSSSTINIPVAKFDATKGTLKGIHITFGSVVWAPTATYSVTADATGFSVVLTAIGGLPVSIVSSVDGTIIADSPGSGYEMDSAAGRFTSTSGVLMNGLQGVNERTMTVRDNTYLSSTLTPAAGVVTFTTTPLATDAKSFAIRGSASATTPNDVLIADVNAAAISNGYDTSSGAGSWNLVCKSEGFSGTTAGGGGTVTIVTTNHLNAEFTVQYDYLAPSVQGDPQIVGFQGQHYQIHGTPDEHYNLISTADYYVNSKFVYMATGLCNYNDTECFSHPGTYIGEIALVSGVNHVKVTSGPHASGLTVYINDKLAPAGTRVRFNNDTSVHVVSHNRVVMTCPDFTLSAVNSDLFLNLGADFTNSAVLHAGHTKVTIPGSATPAEADKMISTAFPEFGMHGLLGQTWRNIVWPHNRMYQGEPGDYLVSNLFSHEFLYSEYQA